MAELNKINGIYILQLTHKQSHPSFHFHAQAQNANTHALKQHRLSENMFTVCSTFVLVIASDMHLESPKRKTSENRWFSHTNSSVRHLIPYCLCLFFFLFFLVTFHYEPLSFSFWACHLALVMLQYYNSSNLQNPVSASYFTHVLSIALHCSL